MFSSKKEIVIIAFLLVVLLSQLAWAARSESATYDEQAHIATGVTFLKQRDFRLDPFNPPLIREIIALPVLLTDPNYDLTDSSWQEARARTDAIFPFSEKFFYQWNDQSLTYLFLGRLMVIGLALLLSGTVYLWARRLFERKAALLALLLIVFEPSLLAHGHLATTDLGVTLFVFLSYFVFGLYVQNRSRRNLLMLGVSLALASTSKISGVVFTVPLWLGFLVLQVRTSFRGGGPRRRNLKQAALALVLLLTSYAILLTSIYLWRFDPIIDPGAAQHVTAEKLMKRVPPQLAGLAEAGFELAEKISMPAKDFRHNLILALTRASALGNRTFVMGRIYEGSVWYFFPAAFLVKTPVPLLVGLLITVLYPVVASKGKSFGELLAILSGSCNFWLLLPAVWIFWISMASKLAFGLRYILPAYPFLVVFVSQAVNWDIWRKRWAQSVGVFLIAWYVFGTLRIAPRYLSYFNELVGGPQNGSKYFLDSNLDWGQDLPELKKFMDEKDVDRIHLAYFGTARPETYGINYEPLPGGNIPLPEDREEEILAKYQETRGWIAVSATARKGLFLPEGSNIDFDWLREEDLVGRVGYSIFVYYLD